MSFVWVVVFLAAAAASAQRAIARRAREVAASCAGTAAAAHSRSSIDAPSLALVSAAAVAGWAVGRAVGMLLAMASVAAVRQIRIRREASIPGVVRQERLADAIGAIAAAVRAGSSLPQAIGYAAKEAEPPVRGDLERLVSDVDLGVPLEVAVSDWAERTAMLDADLVAGALELHRRSGGDLPAVLEHVTSTIRQRVSIAREVRSLTAQARLSAWILGCLPIGFFAFLWLTARQDIQGALSTTVGVACLVAGLVLEAGAFAWIRHLLVVA